MDEVTEPIEPDLLYPLERGRDVQRWRAEPSAWMIVPQDLGDPTRAYPEQQLQKDCPKTYGYPKRFVRELRNRSGYHQILSKREREFYGVMDIGTYTFAPWKVMWTRLARIEAAVIGLHEGKPIVPQRDGNAGGVLKRKRSPSHLCACELIAVSTCGYLLQPGRRQKHGLRAHP
jgi:hypothetical protein